MAPRADGLVREMKTKKVISREEIQERTETEDVKHFGDFTDEVSTFKYKIHCSSPPTLNIRNILLNFIRVAGHFDQSKCGCCNNNKKRKFSAFADTIIAHFLEIHR